MTTNHIPPETNTHTQNTPQMPDASPPTPRFSVTVETITDALFLALFFIVLGVHIMASLLGIKDITIVEKRSLASQPALSFSGNEFIKSWSAYPKAFEVYFNDHFALRSRLIHSYYLLKVKLFRQKLYPTQRVLIGKAGWWFSAGGGTVMEDYQRYPAYSEQELVTMQANLEAINSICQQRGIKFIVVVPPNKESIYPEFMPPEIQPIGDTSRLEQLLIYIQAHERITMLDLRQALLAEKSSQPVYLRTDTHWNDYGAYLAYKHVLNLLHVSYPGMTPHPLQDYDIRKRLWAGNLVYLLTLQAEVKEKITELVPHFESKAHIVEGNDRRTLIFTSSEASLPRALIFGDSFSFTTAFAPFLAEHFSRTFIRHYGYLEQPVLQYIEQEKPDVVILEIVERNLIRLMKPLDQPGGEDTEL